MKTKIEIAANRRIELGLDSDIETAMNHAKELSQDQLNEICVQIEEENKIKAFANELFSRYTGSGKSVMDVIKENLQSIKDFCGTTAFLAEGVERNNFSRNQIL